MKKYLLLIISMVCAVTGAWADAVVSNNKHLNNNDYAASAIRIETTGAGDISSATLSDASSWANMIFVSGPVNEADIIKLNTIYGSYAKIINLTQATGLEASWLSNLNGSAIEGIGVPKSFTLTELTTGENIKVIYSSAFNGGMNYDQDSKGDNEINAYIKKSGGITTFNLLQNFYLLQFRTINLTSEPGTVNESSQEYITLSSHQGITINRQIAPSNAPYTVSGCDVSVNMAKADGKTMSELLADALAKVKEGGQNNICTLTVSGTLTNNDLIALGRTNMTDATRIDLSEATLSSDATIDNLQIPSSLTSLVLPKDQTVSVGLASKLAAATNLWYAYSPSSSTQDDSQAIADYIWVNKPGGLKQAADTEAAIRTAVYVKIESKVALNEDDAKFGSMGISATTETNYPWQYVDMSGAVVTAAATLEATAPHDKGYRIILPDNLTGDNMAIFASNTNHGSIAALYSYSGTTLRILEITDGSYKENALRDSRIVFPGTDAIEIVSGTYNNNRYGLFGDFNSDTDNYLLNAINGADENIKTVILNNVWATTTNLTFSNTHIETLQIDGIHKYYSTTQGSNINVTGCTSLKTLNITNSVINSFDAHGITSLTTVNLNGTKNAGATNLSGSGLKTLTTNSSTEFVGDLDLKSTASFTSFATQAKVTGDIYLNASGVSTVDLQSVQFQNTSSKIHIDSTEGEGDTPLTNLNADGQLTIYIPTGFDRTRLHPYSSEILDDNIAELAGTGAFEDDCNPKCRIEYNAETHVATVHCYTPGHFKTLMENDNNYGKFVDGAIFTFAADCKLNADDLAALAGKDGYGNFNWNYVDLYELPASYTYNSGTVNYADVITGAINILRTNNWQYKGLLLPKAVTTLGTTLIMDAENADPKLATCSQFVAYSGAIGDQALTASYIYKAADDWGISFDERLTKMMAVMNLHSEIVETTTNWSVSTNSATPLDLSSIPASVTIGENTINTSKLETINNDMVAGTIEPSIYAYPAYEGVMTTVTTYTGIGGTPDLETLKVTGPLSAADIASINSFEHGPRVFDLSAATTTITKAMLESITNDNIEYIILPAGMTKEDVCEANYTTGLKTNLKAVISSTSTNLVAYVNTPGSLAEARYFATGGSINNDKMFPTITGLQSVTLAGNLNAADIAANPTGKKVGADGHWGDGADNAISIALSGEQGTIATIDLEKAVFGTLNGETRINQTDMNFSYAGLASISNITLPTHETMTLIPADCFRGIVSFNDLCIPYNYTKIDNAALFNTYCGHITTTDANGAVIDNGEHSYTLSNNLREIGSKPATADENGVYSLSETVFPQNRGVTDVIVRAHKVPKCYANAFPANMLYGWGGFKGGDFPYCREKYDNSTDGSMIFTVLHFPDSTSFTVNKDVLNGETEDEYATMKKLYTDVNKVYTKKEQTGAVDANGDPIAWPTFAELRRAYNQATDGITWNEWTTTPDGNGEVLGGANIPTAKNAIAEGTGAGDYDFSDYEGWHQFTLSMATYVEPSKIIENEVIKNTYAEAGWYTLCVPFNITEDQLIEMLGVPASTASVESYIGEEKITDNILPDLRTLEKVTRQPGTTNKVTLRFTNNLTTNSSGNFQYWEIDNDPAESNYADCGEIGGKKIAIKGGYPYLVKPYLPAGETNVKNLGKYIITRYSKRFTSEQSCMNNAGCYEDLADYSEQNKTGRFAKPYEGHKIQALLDKAGNTQYATHSDDTKYYYTFVGQFWTQPLPLYSFYMVENNANDGTWYHYTSGTKNYKWNAYKCVIMVTPENNDTEQHPNSGMYRDNTKSVYPVSTGTDAQGGYKFTQQLYIEFSNGLDDTEDFNSAAPMHIFTLDNFAIELNGEETTSIDMLDGVEINPTSKNIYSMNGQLMGTSVEGLAKGMYIMNGKKFIVK